MVAEVFQRIPCNTHTGSWQCGIVGRWSSNHDGAATAILSSGYPKTVCGYSVSIHVQVFDTQVLRSWLILHVATSSSSSRTVPPPLAHVLAFFLACSIAMLRGQLCFMLFHNSASGSYWGLVTSIDHNPALMSTHPYRRPPRVQ